MTFTLSELLGIIGSLVLVLTGGGGALAFATSRIERRNSVVTGLDTLNKRLETEVKRLTEQVEASERAAQVKMTALQARLAEMEMETQQRIDAHAREIAARDAVIYRLTQRVQELETRLAELGQNGAHGHD